MRAVVQRVKQSSVIVDDEIVAEIGKGLLVLLGISKDDGINDIKWLADKIVHLRIFEDELGKMNKSVLEVGGELLVVSQFTLYGDCRKGRRPSFSESATPD
ncbi:MAG: D-aminoacyl-tRNA deacylase, partial [Defluviitoga tunisiensis]